MIKTYLTLVLSFVLAFSATAQTKKKTSNRGNTKQKTAMVEMYDLAGEDTTCFDPEKPSKPYVGTIVKRQFADDELTLNGITIREADDERYFINIDAEYVSNKGRFIPRELSSLLTQNRRVKIWVFACGAAGRMLYVSKVQAF